MRITTEVGITMFIEQLAKANIEIPDNLAFILTDEERIEAFGHFLHYSAPTNTTVDVLSTNYGKIKLIYKD